MKRVVVVLAFAACGGHDPAPRALPVVPSRLPAPPPGDPNAHGAAYLRALALQVQPRWAQFLEDCRVRLPVGHPLNAPRLVATVELSIDLHGKLVDQQAVSASGNGDFDTAIADVLGDVLPLPAPPRELLSDDDLVHVRWTFARDRRQAGAATAEVVAHALPRPDVVARLLARGDIAGAARRADGELAEPVMMAALRQGLASESDVVRLAAVEAIARAKVGAFAPDVRSLLAPTVAAQLRVAAAHAVSALGDRAAVSLLAAVDLRGEPTVALAALAALVELGHREDAMTLIANALPQPTALAALALTPVPDARARLAGWFAHGDPRTRAAICAGRPDEGLVRRGLADADATVRAACADAATTVSARLLELATDRDQVVRAHAVTAIARLDPKRDLRAHRDAAANVRAAAVASATPSELALLADDHDPDVRAAAVARLPAGAASAKAAADPAPQVRLAVVELADDATLAKLARDDSPAVATAAAIAIAGRAGRVAATPHLLELLAASPPSSVERVRIALAWLLAR